MRLIKTMGALVLTIAAAAALASPASAAKVRYCDSYTMNGITDVTYAGKHTGCGLAETVIDKAYGRGFPMLVNTGGIDANGRPTRYYWWREYKSGSLRSGGRVVEYRAQDTSGSWPTLVARVVTFR